MNGPGERSTTRMGVVLGAAASMAVSLILCGCGSSTPVAQKADTGRSTSSTLGLPAPTASGAGRGEPPASAVSAPAPLSPAARERVERFCSACHPLPQSENFPREQWPAEVRLGFDLYRASLRSDLPEPTEAEAIRYFQEHAPTALGIPRAADRVEPPSTLRFEPVSVRGIPEQAGPAVAQVIPCGPELQSAGGAAMFTTDMRSGEIRRWRIAADVAASGVFASSGHPCRLTPVPNRSDAWFVADLGSYMPEDHDFGGVSLLVCPGGGPASSEEWDVAVAGTLTPVRTGLSRVVEARPFDFDGEAPLDLLVVEFGWRRTGALRVLLGAGEGGLPTGQRVLDPRHGCLATRIADFDGDGADDVVAVFAQEHETVDVWYRRGPGDFEHRQIHRLPDPSWGSSGLDVTDIDGDGDPDVLHCNGDTMDSGLPRPTHGVRVLLNEGGKVFENREIALLPGVSQATAADLDGDGDLDVVACALLPSGGGRPAGTFEGMVWIEQTDEGWRPHTIERDRCEHAAFALADVDSDGRTDIVAGVFQADAGSSASPVLRVWLNRPAGR